MNLYSALKLADKAREEASKRGEKLAIAVFDATSTLLAFLNMDIEETECVEYAQRKAVTALRTDSDTKELSYLVKKPDGILVSLRYDASICLMGGGKLIRRNGVIEGALGVSGAAEAVDAEIADAAVSAFLKELAEA